MSSLLCLSVRIPAQPAPLIHGPAHRGVPPSSWAFCLCPWHSLASMWPCSSLPAVVLTHLTSRGRCALGRWVEPGAAPWEVEGAARRSLGPPGSEPGPSGRDTRCLHTPDPCSYLVMPFMGTDLGKLMKHEKLSEDRIQFLVYQMLKGLKVGVHLGCCRRGRAPQARLGPG